MINIGFMNIMIYYCAILIVRVLFIWVFVWWPVRRSQWRCLPWQATLSGELYTSSGFNVRVCRMLVGRAWGVDMWGSLARLLWLESDSCVGGRQSECVLSECGRGLGRVYFWLLMSWLTLVMFSYGTAWGRRKWYWHFIQLGLRDPRVQSVGVYMW